MEIYIPELNLGIEYDGIYYHSSEKKKEEAEKDSHLNSLGIRVIRIKECEKPQEVNSNDVIWVSEEKPDIHSALIEIATLYDFVDELPYIDTDADRFNIWAQYISLIKESSLATLFPELSKEWHPTLNGGLLPEQVSAYNDRKVWWQCPKGHDYETNIRNRTKLGSGCPFCAGQKIIQGVNDLFSQNPALCDEWDKT